MTYLLGVLPVLADVSAVAVMLLRMLLLVLAVSGPV